MKVVAKFGAFSLAASLLFATTLRAADTPVATPAQAASPAPVARAADRLELETSAIRGNQELPKVLYIVPWKEPGLLEPTGRPLNSLVDEALAPVDRDVFRRQMSYFDQLYGAENVKPGVGSTAP